MVEPTSLAEGCRLVCESGLKSNSEKRNPPPRVICPRDVDARNTRVHVLEINTTASSRVYSLPSFPRDFLFFSKDPRIVDPCTTRD